MDQPLISVIIPVYNMELYLERCLDSVLNNTYHNLEIICVDDGSKDRSLEILRRYEAADPRIVVIAKENGGVSSARNAGLDRMTGEYVTFIDSDDFVLPQYVELLYWAIKETGTNMSICGFHTVDADSDVEATETFSFDPDDVCVFSYVHIFKTQNLRAYCWGKMFTSTIVKEHKYREDLHLAEDTAFVAEVCENDYYNLAAVLPYSLYCYFQRVDSAVKVATIPQLLQFGRVWCQMMKLNNRDDIYLDKALRWFLSVRYQCFYILPDREAVRESNNYLMNLRPCLWKTGIYGFKDKTALFIFIHFPFIYWLYRVVKDPSMWKWERVERRKRREDRKSNRSTH